MTARHVIVLLVGVFAVSWAAPLIRLAEDAPALTIAALRLSIAAPPMAAIAWSRGGRREAARLARRHVVLMVIAGVALAAHFGVWVAAVQRTSIVTGVVLVTMQPLFVAAGAWIALHERPAPRVLTGIALAGAGALLLAGDDLGDRGSLTGDAMALAGAAFVSLYIVVGRDARSRVSTATYAAIVYSVTAVALLALAAATRTPLLGHPPETYAIILALAVGPQLIGHNAFNWALGSLPAAIVAVAILGEPVGASLIAVAVLDEVPSAVEVAGASVVLAGVYVALRQPPPAAAAPAETIEL